MNSFKFMGKTLSIIVLGFTFFIGILGGSFFVNADEGDSEVRYIEPSINKSLIDIAVKNDLDVDVIDADIRLNLIELEEAYDEAKKSDYIGGNRFSQIQNLKRIDLNPMIAERRLILSLQKKLACNSLKSLEVYGDIESVNIASYKYQASEYGMQYGKKIYDVALLMNDLGKNTLSDLLQAELAYDKEVLKRSDIDGERTQALNELNRELGISLYEPTEVETEIYTLEFDEGLKKDYLDKIALNQPQILKKKLTFEETQLIYLWNKERYETDDKELINAYNNRSMASRDYKSSAAKERLKVKNVYDKLSYAKDLVEAKLVEEAAYRKKSENYKLKYEYGKVSEIEYLEVLDSLKQKEVDRMEAVREYNKLVRIFKVFELNSKAYENAKGLAEKEYFKDFE